MEANSVDFIDFDNKGAGKQPRIEQPSDAIFQ